MTAGALDIFTAHFLSIFIEAMPFLLVGTLVSGLVETYASPDALARIIPRRALPRTVAGALLGFLFPVCECGVVPVARRLIKKSVPASAAIAFLLAAPIINPVVLWSTWTAFGFGPVLYGRFGVAFIVAITVGLLVAKAERSVSAAPKKTTKASEHRHEGARLPRALSTAADETLEMGFYLVIGCTVASAMQVIVPEAVLTAVSGGDILSVVVMQVTAFILSVCSTVDAFIALGFVGIFGTGSIVSFLTFGPMVDIKSVTMFAAVFSRRTVMQLVLWPLGLTFLAGFVLNLLLP